MWIKIGTKITMGRSIDLREALRGDEKHIQG